MPNFPPEYYSRPGVEIHLKDGRTIIVAASEADEVRRLDGQTPPGEKENETTDTAVETTEPETEAKETPVEDTGEKIIEVAKRIIETKDTRDAKPRTGGRPKGSKNKANPS